MIKKLSAVGNSLGLIIERPILDLLNITKDTPLEVRTDGEGLIQVVPVLSRMHTVFGSPEEDAVRARVRGFLNEMGPTSAETLSIEADADLVVLHNDDEVYRTGCVLMGDALQGAPPPQPRRLLSDYFAAGMGLVDPAEHADIGMRILPPRKADQAPLIAK